MPHSTEDRGPSVEAFVNYHQPPPEGEVFPVQYVTTVGFQRQKYDRQLVTVTDIRQCDETFSLDKQGFEVVQSTIQEKIWDGDYRFGLPPQLNKDVQEMVMRHSGASYVHPFAPHVIRSDPIQKVLDIPKDISDKESLGMTPPATFIHVGKESFIDIFGIAILISMILDQSYDGAEVVLNRLPEADKLRPLTRSRWGIINVWQPLKAVNREPLAMCDARSVEEHELRPVTTRIVIGQPPNTINKDNEQWHLTSSPQHRWYYASGMTSDEALLIKNFDSKLDGRARRVPHTAIQTPYDEGPPRQSIEIRCLVFWESEEKE